MREAIGTSTSKVSMTSDTNSNSPLGTKAFKNINSEGNSAICGCSNPICIHHIDDRNRANRLLKFTNRLQENGWPDVQLMPLRENKRGPIIRGKCELETEEARSLLVTPEEAARRIREEGVRGFYIYADMESHGTEGLIFSDEDVPEAWPDVRDTLRVVSGSGTSQHGYWANDGWHRGADGKDDLEGIGGVRVIRTGVVVPGSVHHDSGGIYHVIDDCPPAPLSPDDLPPELRPRTDGSLPSDEASHSPPDSIDEKAVSRVQEMVRAFYGHEDTDGFGLNGGTQRAQDMLTDLLRGRYRRGEDGMSRDVVTRFETTEDRGKDRECRHKAEQCLTGLLYGIIKRHGSMEDRDEASDLLYHYLSHVCNKHPKTTEGRRRLWHVSERYRRTTIHRAIEGFNREWFRRWRRKKYNGGQAWTDDYSEVTYATVVKAIIDLSDDFGSPPTQHQFPTRREITFLCKQRDDRSEETYREALSRLVNQYGEVKRADLGNNQQVYYLTWRDDPEEAESIHPEPERDDF